MNARVFVSEPPSGDRYELSGPEAHHLLHVLRVAVGQLVTLFDGQGIEYQAQVERVDRRSIDLTVLSRLAVNRELCRPLVLVVALPKGDRQRWLVEKCVELGVTELRPLVATRTVAEPGDKTQQRLERYVIEASKQCGRNRLMAIGVPLDVSQPAQLLTPVAAPAGDLPWARWIADPSATVSCAAAMRQQLSAGVPGGCLLIGPEGGWTPTELDQIGRAGWQPVGLGPRILRVETAALAAASIWSTLPEVAPTSTHC